MARTLVTGNILRSGSIPTTALGGGVVTSSLQIVASLPTGSLSSSAQVNYPDISNIPGGIASSSTQIKDYLPVDTVSSSAQVTAFLPTGTVSSSTQLPSGIASSSAQVTAYLPTGTVSSSGQVDVFNTIGGGALATTGSNTFTAAQTISDTANSTSYLDGALHIAGGMSVRKDVRISGSMTINGLLTAVSMSTQYVTSSEYNIGVSKITLNDDDTVRFAGLSIYDSGSASPTSASIYWDSLQHRFIYENLSGSAYNSAILIAGPKHTGSLGDEPTLTGGYIPVATGGDHIDNSVMFQSSSRIGVGITTPSLGTLQINGNVHATSYTGSISGSSITANTLAISGTAGASIARINATQDQAIFSFTDTQDNTGYFGIRSAVEAGEQGASFFTDGALFFGRLIGGSFTERMRIDSSGNIGVGTTNPGSKLQVDGQVRIINGSGNNPGGYLWIEDQNGLTYSATSENTPSFTVKNEQSGANRVSTLRLSARDSGGGLSNWNISSIGVGSNRGILAIQNGIDERLRIDSSGNVGIGTTNPGYKLDVYTVGGSTATTRLYGNDQANVRLRLENVGSGGRTWELVGGLPGANNSNFSLYDVTGTTTRLTVDSSGNLAVDTNTLYVDAVNNTVGIGTATPGTTYQLTVRRDGADTGVRIGNNTTYDQYIYFNGNNDWSMGMDYSNSNAFVISNYSTLGTNDRVVLTTGGNFGIGTTGPNAKLEVVGRTISTNVVVGAYGTLNDTTGTSQTLQFGNYSAGAFIASSADAYIYKTSTVFSGLSAQTLIFQTRSDTDGGGFAWVAGSTPAVKMYINSSGNVGIGTTAPNLSAGSAGSTYLTLSTSTSGRNSVLELNGARSDSGGYTGYVRFFNNVAATPLADIQAIRAGADTTGSLAFATTNVERMRIDESGKVGIGIASPVQKLHIEGNAAIGTTGTEDILLLGRAISGGVSFQQAASFKLGRYQNAGGSFESYTRLDIALRDNSAASNYNTNTTVMTLTNAGNVGIGTTNPVTKFDINSSGPQGLSLSPDTGNSGVSSRLFFGASGGTVSMYGAGTALYFNTGATIGSTSGNPAAVITANGIGLGNNIPASGTGIKFPSTQSPSSDANMLDDYEEGTWTPEFRINNSTAGVTYDSTYRYGYYTKIGNTVTIHGGFKLSSNGSSTGEATIHGIPFNATDIDAYRHPGVGSATIVLKATNKVWVIVVSTSSLFFRDMTAVNADTPAYDTDFDDDTAILFTITYKA